MAHFAPLTIICSHTSKFDDNESTFGKSEREKLKGKHAAVATSKLDLTPRGGRKKNSIFLVYSWNFIFLQDEMASERASEPEGAVSKYLFYSYKKRFLDFNLA
jgi:hypothetical protein